MFRRATVGALPLGMFLALLVAAILSVGFLLVLVSYNNPASAQTTTTTITVNTKADEVNTDGDCSLREAIQAADTNSPVDECPAGSDAEQDTILFALGDKATIKLGSELLITDDAGLTIDGRKAKITVSGNKQTQVFEVNSGAKLTLARLTVADGNVSNDAGGGILNFGTLEVTNSTFSKNSARFGGGGGIANGGTLEVTNSTFSDNSTSFGGGIDNGGTLTVTNSTFSDNSAEFSGGGIINQGSGTLEVTNSTFSGNSANDQGGGISNTSIGTTTLSNTIVANSPSGGNCANQGTLIDGGYNIDDGTSCGFSEANNSMPSTDPKLDPKGLQNNDGPTKTIKLLPGSPAVSVIPKGTNGCGTEIKTDQRGVKRPQGPGCDIGAFEKRHHVQPNP